MQKSRPETFPERGQVQFCQMLDGKEALRSRPFWQIKREASKERAFGIWNADEREAESKI